MRLFVVIPHYFGPGDPLNSSPVIGAYIEPLSRIAALSETIAALHRNFGPYRSTFEGAEILPPSEADETTVDIVIVTMRDRNVLSDLGLDPSVYNVEWVEGRPTSIPFHAQRLMKERLGRYDFYCLMEDDLAIHDPDFFAKLRWFQDQFGVRALLAPTRVETSYVGTPAKVIADPFLPEELSGPFRRPGQRDRITASWHGEQRGFAIPNNPHAASFFLTGEQLAHWVAQPTFDDHDASWVGPVESGVTLGIGKVFDIYKSASPDSFFLEIHHYGTSYAARNPPHGRRYGEPPLLAIAQGAMRARAGECEDRVGCETPGAPVRAWIAQGTAGEAIGQLMRESHAFTKVERFASELSERAQAQSAEITAMAERLDRVTREHNAEIAAMGERFDRATREHLAERAGLTERIGRLTQERDALRSERDLHQRSLRRIAHNALRETRLRLSRVRGWRF